MVGLDSNTLYKLQFGRLHWYKLYKIDCAKHIHQRPPAIDADIPLHSFSLRFYFVNGKQAT